MKLISFLYAFFYFGIVFSFGQSPVGNNLPDRYISLKQASENRQIEFRARSLGGHSGYCVEVSIHNMRNDSIFLFIEAGRRLIAKDSVLQDILIAKNEKIALPPMGAKKTIVYGFCCQSSDLGPAIDAEYLIGYMAPQTWLILANFINDNAFSDRSVQHAIWVLSNGHPVSSIINEKEQDWQLRNKVCELIGIEVPWYNIFYETDSTRVFTNRIERVTGEIPFYVKNNSSISVRLINERGHLVRILQQPSIYGPGQYYFVMDVLVKNWPKGEYTVAIYEDNSNLNTKRKFLL